MAIASNKGMPLTFSQEQLQITLQRMKHDAKIMQMMPYKINLLLEREDLRIHLEFPTDSIDALLPQIQQAELKNREEMKRLGRNKVKYNGSYIVDEHGIVHIPTHTTPQHTK